jgi:hypothetical protein
LIVSSSRCLFVPDEIVQFALRMRPTSIAIDGRPASTVVAPTPLTPTRTDCVEWTIENTSLAFTAFTNTDGTIRTGLPLMISVSVTRPSKLPVAASNVPTFTV